MKRGRGLVPDAAVGRISEIPLEALRARGIAGVIFDLDNTLVPYRTDEVPSDVQAWVAAFRRSGLRGAVVSNANFRRAATLARHFGWPAIGGLPKPNPCRLVRAMRAMHTTPATTALVGDQLFTDVLPGNWLGLYTILVEPMDRREFVTTRLMRWLERVVGRDRLVRCTRAPD
ncbi:MAG: YqeG family HAD IIIA-type phosphatase [Armatimonadota bacterium]|nr:YqeG family HAD IIIA-type phosphatase [Armatimonadota bacterium]MDR5696586.1 YqeG family HAD IIIA-type phosphatase [Armatimonadota bacterium]